MPLYEYRILCPLHTISLLFIHLSKFYRCDMLKDMGPSLYYVSKRTWWKWPVLLTFSNVFMLIRWVGGVQKCWRNIGMAPYLAKAWTCLNMSTYWIFLWSYCLLKKCKLKIDFSLSPTTLVSSPKSYLSAY